jgi:hypothetical protein
MVHEDRYLLTEEPDGDLPRLLRIRRDAQGLAGAYWSEGRWVDYPYATTYLHDMSGVVEITLEQAETMKRTLAAKGR